MRAPLTVFCTPAPEDYIPVPTLSERMIVCGPFVSENRSSALRHAIRTRAGRFDLAESLARLSPFPQPEVVVVWADAARLVEPTNLRAVSGRKVLVIGDTHHLDKPIRTLLDYALLERFDTHIIVATRHHAHFFAEAGLENVFWIPSLVTTPIERAFNEERRRNVTFVGQTGTFHPRRRRLLEAVAARGFPLEVVRCSPEEAARRYSESVISLNVSLNSDLNFRPYEVLAAGGFLLTDRLSREAGLEQFYREGEHYVAYDSLENLCAKLDYYLERPSEALSVARAGQAACATIFGRDRIRRAFWNVVIEGRTEEPFDLRHERRVSSRPPLSVPKDLFGHVALYEFFQEQHLREESVKVLVLTEESARLVADVADLPRLRFYVEAGGRCSGAIARSLREAGIEHSVESIDATEARNEIWDVLVAPVCALSGSFRGNQVDPPDGATPAVTLESYDFRHLVVPGLGTEQIATVQTTHPGLAPVEPNVPVFFRRGTQPTVESGIRRPRRLHIGGRVRSPGWEVLDAVSRPEVDHVGNAGDLSRFADGSFAAVYASHVLEHFDYKVAVTSALREWWRVLEPGGRLFVSVPDLSVLSRLFVDRQLTGADRFLVMRMMFGGHDDRYDYHLVGLDEEILTGFLEHAGFEAVTRVSSFGLFDDTSVLELNGTPISLNITATKRQDAPRYDGGATPLARNEHPLPDIRDDAAEISLPEFLDAAGALVGAGKLDDAEACYRHAIAQLAPALHEAGVIALRRAGLEGARALLSAACEMAPDSAKSWLAYGRALVLSARHVEATNALQRAVALDGALADAHALLGLCHGNQGRREEAAIHLERATTLAPDDVLGWKLLGALRWQEGRLSDAEHALKRALASSPNDGDTWNNLGAILHDQHDDISGDLAFHRALEVGPETDYVEHNRLFYATCSSEKSPVEIAALHREWGERISARCVGARRPHMNERAPNRRLRIGYLSPNLNEHSVAFFLKPVLAEHSRDELEVVCFADGGVRDWMTSALEACADRWLDVANLTDDELDAVIRREEIDVLVELAGHSANCRLSLCARCVAPVQVTYLGYPNTTGLSSIQYRITDSYADAPGATEGWHTEELVRPFRSFLCYEPPPRSPAVVAPPCVRKGVTTFGDFNHYRKLNRPTVALWSRVLHAAPGSRLLLKSSAMADPACRTRLFGWLAEEGIAPERVEVAPYKRRLHEHLACYGEMDVALDTFPYNGTTTTCEALWMGVPVVTRFGIDHRSRVGLSLLSNAGFPELAAESDDAFVSAAVRLASDPDGLALRRRTLRDRLRAAPLMDASGFTRALEGAYRSMWRKWCSDGPALGGA